MIIPSLAFLYKVDLFTLSTRICTLFRLGFLRLLTIVVDIQLRMNLLFFVLISDALLMYDKTYIFYLGVSLTVSPTIIIYFTLLVIQNEPCLVYMNDIIVDLPTIHEHLSPLTDSFKRLQ